MTPHYDSDVPVQYGSWAEYDVMRPWSIAEKNATALAAVFLSNCHANSFRKEVRVTLRGSKFSTINHSESRL